MTDLLLVIAFNNICISLVLALVACGVHASGKNPRLAHLLWLLVLLKLITPPLWTLSSDDIPSLISPTPSSELQTEPVTLHDRTDQSGQVLLESASATAADTARTVLLLLWLLGSMGVLVWSLAHVIRFNRLLRVASRRAGPQLQAAGHQLAHALGLKTKPSIHTTMAHLSPML